MQIGFWMVMANEPGRHPPTVRHSDYQTAVREAKRLALKVPGEKFFVLAAVGVANTPEPVTFEKLHHRDEFTDEIPF